MADTEFHEERDGAMKSGFWLSAIGLILAGCGKLITIEPYPDDRFYTLPVGTLVNEMRVALGDKASIVLPEEQ